MAIKRHAEYDPIRGLVMRILCKRRQLAFALHSQVSARGTAWGTAALALHSHVSTLGPKPGERIPMAMTTPATNLSRVNMICCCIAGAPLPDPCGQLPDTSA